MILYAYNTIIIIGGLDMIKFEVFDKNGVNVTEEQEWYIDPHGCLYFMTNDIDSPLQEAEDYGYTYKVK